MAEGILREVAGDILDVQCTRSEPAGYVHPMTMAVMREIGIDLSGHRSKSLTEFLDRPVETVITVCGRADQACPMFPGQVHRHHWPFEDPARATGTEEERLAVFRRVRDEIRRVFEAYAAGRRDELGESRGGGSGDVRGGWGCAGCGSSQLCADCDGGRVLLFAERFGRLPWLGRGCGGFGASDWGRA